MSKNSLFLVFAAPHDGQEDAFNSWYSDTHIPDVLRAPGAESAQRFQLEHQSGAPLTDYLAIYQMSDPASAFADIGRRAGSADMVISPALKSAAVRSINFELAEGGCPSDAPAYLVALWDKDTASAPQGSPSLAVLKRSDVQSRAGDLPPYAAIAALSEGDTAAQIAALTAKLSGASSIVIARPL